MRSGGILRAHPTVEPTRERQKEAHHVSVREVASEFLKASGHDSVGDFERWVVSAPDRPLNDNDYVVSGDELRDLEWAQHVFFEEGLNRTVEWYRENGDKWWKELNGSAT
ncbi:hypothetical protein ASPCADRAFT_6983 [Aspergillus carbonarius ITEM 5010]|uniref:NAD(P)-binding domain-containing protein n=1 Tax=Aspergillus carbonarius (strain ITEM 5010) TaxID=602072 RepID=A0A1R3RIJ8_ASPC5|nr:hypothetical protein ASPCADRAFT_6983 [Aspergillus carbonarius ITEM 5010]